MSNTRSDRNLDNLLLNRILHELCLVVDVELTHQVELVSLNGFYAQVQVLRNFLYRLAFGQELKDLFLTRRQGRETRLTMGRLDPRAEIIDELRKHTRAEVAAATMHVAPSTQKSQEKSISAR